MRRVLRKILPAGSKQRIFAGKVKRIVLFRSGHNYQQWIKDVEPGTLSPVLIEQPTLMTIIVPTYNTPKRFIKELIISLKNQSYKGWKLILADGSTDGECADYIRKIAEVDERITYTKLERNHGISGNTNKAVELSKTKYIAFLDHDDILPTWAINEVANSIKDNPRAVLFYSDEDKLSLNGKKRSWPLFKPDWSPDLLLSVNYLAHFIVLKKEVFDSVGGLRPKYDGAQDYDLMLRITEVYGRQIVHIPKILYHWRLAPGSTALAIGEKTYADTSGINALNEYISRNKVSATTIPVAERPTNYQIKYNITKNTKVSIIIPFKDKPELLRQCVGSILSKTRHKNYEIVLVSNNSVQKLTFKYLDSLKQSNIVKLTYNKTFNYSAINNYGRKHATGDVIVFLNNDTKVISPDWLEELAANALRPEIGAVGPMLLYPDKTIQHAGIVLGMTGMAGHVFRNLHPGTYTPYGITDWPRNYLAVTGACLAIEAKKLDSINGFREDFIICGSDVTLCLDIVKAGFRNLYWPYVRLTHYESKSVGSYKNIPKTDYDLSLVHYGPYLKNTDPYYNPNLDLMIEVPTPRRKHA